MLGIDIDLRAVGSFMRHWKTILCLIPLSLLACGEAKAPGPEPPAPTTTQEDLVVVTAGKADSMSFFPDRLMEDHVFEDGSFLSTQDIQNFLEMNPYG